MTNAQILNELAKVHVYKTKLKVFLINHHPKLYNAILANTKFLDTDNPKRWTIEFSERLFCIEHNISKRPLCKGCKKEYVKFKKDIRQYAHYCSKKCSQSSEPAIEKRSEALKKLNWHEILKDYRQKLKDNPELMKQNIAKGRETRQKKYGGWHSPEFAKNYQAYRIAKGHPANWVNPDKAKKTLQNRYGSKKIRCALQLPHAKELTRIGLKKKSYRYMKESEYIEPLFSEDEFINMPDSKSLKFKCKICGAEYVGKWNNGLPSLCKKCHPGLVGTSESEIRLFEFIKKESAKVGLLAYNKEKINRQIISPKELDIVVTDKNGNVKLAIEYDGAFWHSDSKQINPTPIVEKTNVCSELGINLIHVFESEWLTKRKIVESRLSSILGLANKKIFARKCAVREITPKESCEFQEANHLQGAAPAKIHIGLFSENKLVSVMTFGKPRYEKMCEWELIRFCCALNTSVIGGAGKLLSYFEQTYKPTSLLSYADRRWSRGNLYKALGFKLKRISRPNYWYFKPNNAMALYSRVKFQKHKQNKLLKKFDPNKTEVENMAANGYLRIFDAGNFVFVKEY